MKRKTLAELPRGAALRAYRTRNGIRAYKTDWSRKTGRRRILPRIGAKVTPTTVGAIVKHPGLMLKLYLVNNGAYFWHHSICALVRRCHAAAHKCLPSWRRECIRQNRRALMRHADEDNVPHGWDLYD
jgi:hypothetical protein